MPIELRLQKRDSQGELEWEGKIQYFNEYLFYFPEYREAVFGQAGRLLGNKLEKHLKGIKDE